MPLGIVLIDCGVSTIGVSVLVPADETKGGFCPATRMASFVLSSVTGIVDAAVPISAHAGCAEIAPITAIVIAAARALVIYIPKKRSCEQADMITLRIAYV